MIFGIVFRLECLIASGDETCETGDLDLIQHVNVDMVKLTRLLNGELFTGHFLLIDETMLFFSRGSSEMAIIEKTSSDRISEKC